MAIYSDTSVNFGIKAFKVLPSPWRAAQYLGEPPKGVQWPAGA